MTRTESCLKNIGSATLVFVEADQDAEIGFAKFDFEQRIKAYPNRARPGRTSRSSISRSQSCRSRSTRRWKASR